MADRSHAAAQAIGWAGMIVVALLALSNCEGATSPPTAAASPDQSTPAYVAARSLRCRSEPTKTAPVRETLTRNEPVTIVKRDGDWSELTRVTGNCWVASAYVSDAPPPASDNESGLTADSVTDADQATAARRGLATFGDAPNTAAHRSSRVRSGTSRTSGTHRPRPSRGLFEDGSCPCSDGNVCIGPRGGRYCITRGGNKRYGV